MKRCKLCGADIPESNEICETCEHELKTRVYYCDAQKNTQCKKTACYINGGPCMLTTHSQYRRRKDDN